MAGPPSLELILGPMLMGTIVNIFLFGIMVVQCYLYYLWYKEDRLALKFIVAFLLLIDAVSSGFDIAMTYQYLVLSFGNFENIGLLNLGITPYPLLTGITSLVVQTFFAWRIAILTNRNWSGYGICLLSVIQLLGSLGTSIGGKIVGVLAELEKVKSVALVWLIGSALTDIIITATLVLYLRKKRTGFATTDDVISKIIRVTMQTGLLTSACALSVVIAYLISESSMHLAFGIPLSKLYTNSLLSTLNMRQGWNTSGFTTVNRASVRGQDSSINRTTANDTIGSQGTIIRIGGSNRMMATLPEDTYELGKYPRTDDGKAPHAASVATPDYDESV